MKIQFLHPAILVQDIGISKRFYVDVLGLRVIEEHQDFVLFEMHFSIHQAQALWKTVFGEEGHDAVLPRNKDCVHLYFETDDLEGAYSRIGSRVDLIHPIARQPWGQMVFRFRDPDGYLVEIGDPMPNYAEWASYAGKFFSGPFESCTGPGAGDRTGLSALSERET